MPATFASLQGDLEGKYSTDCTVSNLTNSCQTIDLSIASHCLTHYQIMPSMLAPAKIVVFHASHDIRTFHSTDLKEYSKARNHGSVVKAGDGHSSFSIGSE